MLPYLSNVAGQGQDTAREVFSLVASMHHLYNEGIPCHGGLGGNNDDDDEVEDEVEEKADEEGDVREGDFYLSLCPPRIRSILKAASRIPTFEDYHIEGTLLVTILLHYFNKLKATAGRYKDTMSVGDSL